MGGSVEGAVRGWLRAEGLAVLILAAWLYAEGGGSWTVFLVAFLLPDVSFAAYLAGPRVGASGYNVAHSYIGPILLAVLLPAAGFAPAAALIWAAHVGFDRALGYGLKYPTAFQDTHLGRIGRNRQ